ANYIIRKVHEGACRMHAGVRSVVAKIMRQGAEVTQDAFNVHHGPLALLPMGSRYLGSTARRFGEAQVHHRGYRLLYQMDGSEALSQDHR
nr:hypothetical protein [Tanacetum cinerariifolium]